MGCRETSTGQRRHRLRRVRPEWELLYSGLSCIDCINIYRICQPRLFVPRQIMLSDSTKQLFMHFGIRCFEFATTTVSCLLTIYSLSSIKLVGGWSFCRSIFISFLQTFSQHEDHLCRGWSAPWTSIALEVALDSYFLCSSPPVCFVSKICIKVIVLNKADLETRQYSTKLKIIFIYYHIISHSRSGDEKYIPCRAWV